MEVDRKAEEVLRAEMTRRDLSTEDLAVAIRCSASTARNLLAGKSVGFKYLYRAARYFGLEPEVLWPEMLPRGISPPRAKTA